MTDNSPSVGELFDEWPDAYDEWFTTPIGSLVKQYETEMLLDMLSPCESETILDVGCGTGVFTGDILAAGASVVGLDLSRPMLRRAQKRFSRQRFMGIVGNMLQLPLADESFDRVYSMTALEFVSDARAAIAELDRVTRKGGNIVLTTLNSLSPWAERRMKKARQGHKLFQTMTFRSPQELLDLTPAGAQIKTAIFFSKDEDPGVARDIEAKGRILKDMTGACVAVSWRKT